MYEQEKDLHHPAAKMTYARPLIGAVGIQIHMKLAIKLFQRRLVILVLVARNGHVSIGESSRLAELKTPCVHSNANIHNANMRSLYLKNFFLSMIPLFKSSSRLIRYTFSFSRLNLGASSSTNASILSNQA